MLIADDEQLIRTRLVTAIDWEAFGFQVCGEAANGQELMQQTKQLEPDVVLTDIRMPLMDGIEFVGKLRQEDRYDPLIIIISGFAEFEYAQKLLRYGIFDYILKPIDKDRLYDILNKARQVCENKYQEQQIRLMQAIRDVVQGKQLHFGNYNLGAGTQIVLVSVYTESMDHSQKLSAVMDQLLQEYESHFLGVVEMEEDTALLAAQIQLGQYDRFIEWLENAVAGHFAIGLSAFASPILENMESIFRLANQFVRLTEDASHCGMPGRVYRFSDVVPSRKIVDTSLFTHLEQGIKRSINTNSAEELERLISETTEQLRFADMLFSDIKNYLFMCMNHVYAYLQEQNYLLLELREEFGVFFEEFSKQRYLVVLMRHIADLVQVVLLHLQESPQNDLSACVRKAMTYLDIYYKQDISLNLLARQVGLNSAYLSHVFSETTGVSIKTYLKNKRLAEAERRLKESTDKIYEIADSVGFGNSRYFSNLFKERTGLNPNEYRNKFGSMVSGGNGQENNG